LATERSRLGRGGSSGVREVRRRAGGDRPRRRGRAQLARALYGETIRERLSEQDLDELGALLRAASERGIDEAVLGRMIASLTERLREAETEPTEWLGHADPVFTLWTYVHLMDAGVGDAGFMDEAVGNGWATRDPETAATPNAARSVKPLD
jgi:hypothetical protein